MFGDINRSIQTRSFSPNRLETFCNEQLILEQVAFEIFHFIKF